MPCRRQLALACALVALTSCADLQKLALSGLQRPTLTYESWAARDLDLDGVTVLLHYRVENPNAVGLDLAKVGYRVELEGTQVAEGQLPGGLKLRASGASPVDFPIRVRWRDVPRIGQIVLTQRDVAYKVSGVVGVGSSLGTVDLPFEHADRVAVPRPPALRLEGVSIRDASLSSVSLDLRLRVDNGNAFPLPVGALTYGLQVGQRDLLSGASHPLAAVPAHGDAVVAIPVRLSTAGMAQAATDLMRGAAVRLRGVAGFGSLQVPVDASAPAR